MQIALLYALDNESMQWLDNSGGATAEDYSYWSTKLISYILLND